MILDTSFLIDYLKGKLHKGAIDKMENVHIAAISCMELYFGALRFGNKEEQEKILLLSSSFAILDFDINASLEASKIMYDLEKKGSMIDLPDIMIAAIAKANNQSIVTRNSKHFSRIEDLKVLDYQKLNN
ncbi:type II toxin-antitoxin system VapC family toxin [Candidatus Woesearchaeota archaeon]|nr:type II toxin-antitoxin system VapC family toxin [Candidatus Woesearchaeota archaeon]